MAEKTIVTMVPETPTQYQFTSVASGRVLSVRVDTDIAPALELRIGGAPVALKTPKTRKATDPSDEPHVYVVDGETLGRCITGSGIRVYLEAPVRGVSLELSV